jgi:hypothetical protein
MQIWLVTTEAEDGSFTKHRMARSEGEARKIGSGDGVNGEAQCINVAVDKDGVMALFHREDFIKDVLKAFDIKNGRWKARGVAKAEAEEG